MAAWQWFNWTLERVPEGITPLRLNFDETSCRLFYEAAPGILGSEPLAAAAKKGYITQQVTRHQKRGALSYLALLCDDTAIQPTLPQVIIGNEHCLPDRVRKELVDSQSLMKNVTLLRQKSAWVTDAVLSQVVAIWGNALRASRLTHQPILLLDACSTHMGPRFLAACVRWNIWLVFVPAKTTWLLQPADTHCFATFKKYLRDYFEEALLANPDGVVDIKSVILQLDKTIRKVLHSKRWAPAFDANGWSKAQQLLRPKIRTLLELQEDPAAGSALPTLQQFQKIFPQRRYIPLPGLLNHFKKRRDTVRRDPRPIAPAVQREPLAPPAHPWHGRLRSSSRLDLTPVVGAPVEACAEVEHADEAPLPPPAADPDTVTETVGVAVQTSETRRVPVGIPLRRPRSMRMSAGSSSACMDDEPRPAKTAKTSAS